MEHENQQHELTLPALLPGSEYKTDDPDRWRKDNLFGLAIAVVVHAHEGEVPKPQRQAWFDLWEDNRKKADQYWKKVAKFNYRHDPGSYGFQAPDTDSECTFEFLFIRPWLMKALFTTPDWGRLYSIIASQLTPSERHHSEWWVKLRDICRRAQTSIEPFDAIAEIQKISEEYRTEKEQDTTLAKRRGIIGWLKKHPHSYSLTGAVIFLILFFVLGLFKVQWRYWCWGTAGIAFLVLIVSLLGGRSR